MGWSIQIARPFGIDLKVHATFFIIVLMAAFRWAPLGLAGAAFGVGLVLALFTCVALHELGHALAARAFGLPVRTITLLPIGGIAHLDREPREARQELIIAAAGPAVNVVIAGILYVLMNMFSAAVGTSMGTLVLMSPAVSLPSAMVWLLQANVALVLFNMLPAFPMDGGRILRALLAFRMEYGRATQIAGTVSQVLTAVVAMYALFTGQVFLLAIAAMIFISASAAKRSVATEPETFRPVAEPVAATTAANPEIIRVAVRRVGEAGPAYQQRRAG